jgi:polysaccharide export outer membrane protein
MVLDSNLGRIYLRFLIIVWGTLVLQLPTSAQREIPVFDERDRQLENPTPTRIPIPIPQEKIAPIPISNQTGVVSTAYLLGPGDEIQIDVFEYEEFNGKKVILPDGTIALPLVGSVIAANRTIPDLTRELKSRLQAWLVSPVITINLIKARPLRINVAGEVQRPGPIQLSSETLFINNTSTGNVNARSPTVHGALLAAGGVTRNADLRQVILKRYSPTGNSPPIIINLWDTLLSANGPRDLILQDGDSIFVSSLAAADSVDRRLLARSTFSPTTVRVRVVGEVKKPGEFEVPPNSSLSSAVAIAGGPTDKAKLENVRFIRLKDDGTIEDRGIDISSLNDTYQIQDGDVIVVPKSRTSTALDFASDLVNPLGFLINLYRAIRGD